MKLRFASRCRPLPAAGRAGDVPHKQQLERADRTQVAARAAPAQGQAPARDEAQLSHPTPPAHSGRWSNLHQSKDFIPNKCVYRFKSSGSNATECLTSILNYFNSVTKISKASALLFVQISVHVVLILDSILMVVCCIGICFG